MMMKEFELRILLVVHGDDDNPKRSEAMEVQCQRPFNKTTNDREHDAARLSEWSTATEEGQLLASAIITRGRSTW